MPVGLGVGRLRGWAWPGVLTLVAVLSWGWLGTWHIPDATRDLRPPALFLLWTPPWFVVLLAWAAPVDRFRLIALARWREAGVTPGLLAVTMLVLLFLGWALPAVPPDRYVSGEPELALPPIRVLPALVEPFARRLGLAAALVVAAALAAMRGARR